MKKSIFALLFALSALMVSPLTWAEDLPEISATDDDAPLPPLIDPAAGDEASGN
ncbi:MAG: hypothetical protein N2Z69_01950 [Methylophilaceae bacterium]|nr:hypothetical protein [Methylophilaceae bacterium]